MSILIKGMEMPTSCLECAFYRKTDPVYDYCCISHAIPKGYVPDDCPLISVPPHGDLIERKTVFLTDFEIAMCDGDYKEGMKMLLEKIESSPTIIPEEGENGT